MTSIEPGKRVYWFMLNELKIRGSDASSFFERFGGNAEKVIAALLTTSASAFPTSPKVAVAANLKVHQNALKLMQCIVKHWRFLSQAGLTTNVSRVTIEEWNIFDGGNPYILIHCDGVRASALQNLPATPTAKRYGVALDRLLNTDRSSLSRTYMYSEFTQSGLEHSEDFLEFDPSLGARKDHVMWREEDDDPLESFADAKARVKSVNYPTYCEFNRMRNRIVLHAGAFWLFERRAAETLTAGLVAEMIVAGEEV